MIDTKAPVGVFGFPPGKNKNCFNGQQPRIVFSKRFRQFLCISNFKANALSTIVVRLF